DNPEIALRTVGPGAIAGENLVEDEHNASPGRLSAHEVEEGAVGEDRPRGVIDWLHDHGREVVAILRERTYERRCVVERQDHNLLCGIGRKSGRLRPGNRRIGGTTVLRRRPEAEGEGVVEAVEVSFKLEDTRPTGVGAG